MNVTRRDEPEGYSYAALAREQADELNAWISANVWDRTRSMRAAEDDFAAWSRERFGRPYSLAIVRMEMLRAGKAQPRKGSRLRAPSAEPTVSVTAAGGEDVSAAGVACEIAAAILSRDDLAPRERIRLALRVLGESD